MGKSLPSTTRLQEFSRIITSDKLQRPRHAKPASRIKVVSSPEQAKSRGVRVESEQLWLKMEESSEKGQQQSRVPLAEVVSDCVKRWFQDTLKEAKAGDSTTQVLVGQMYYSGYGVPRDAQKGRAWISKASKSRSSAWKVSDKHPGYNASDSDSDDMKGDAK
uniref:Sel1-like protein n=1 Tax=Davidia involucrata TaxID=16924 RepID=A0A5B7B620_DAVIN